MTFENLRCFVAIAEELDFKKGARRLNMSQQKARSQIQALAESTKVVLFEKTPSGQCLTKPGMVLLERARKLLEYQQQMVSDVQKTSQNTLRIGNVGQLGHNFFPTFIRTCHKRFPEVTIEFTELDIIQQHAEAILNDKIDIGFVSTHELPKLKGVSSALLIDTHSTVAMKSGHPLAKLKRISLKALQGHSLLALESANARLHSKAMKEIFKRRGLEAGPTKIVGGFASLIVMLAGGFGISLLPDALNLNKIEGITSRQLQEEGDDLRFQLHVIWKSPEIKPFIEILLRSVTPSPKTTGHRTSR